MLPLEIAQQTSSITNAEPMLIAATAALSAVVLGWFGTVILKIKREWEDWKITWYGNPLDSNPNGFKRKLDGFIMRADAHISEQRAVNHWTARVLGKLTHGQIPPPPDSVEWSLEHGERRKG